MCYKVCGESAENHNYFMNNVQNSFLTYYDIKIMLM